ncbi:MAG: hypothetical protein ABL926_03955 [Novosphingobium sp.]|uniref:hypothetical protein n=1 Tax=Novosphingobium sp. TaxID=1874826 RepID=UPI0032B81148
MGMWRGEDVPLSDRWLDAAQAMNFRATDLVRGANECEMAARTREIVGRVRHGHRARIMFAIGNDRHCSSTDGRKAI